MTTFVAIALAIAVAAPAGAQVPDHRLTFEDAMARALRAAPQMDAARAGHDAARALQRQALARPNPSVRFDLEPASELTWSLEQQLELGGKRGARARAAAADAEAARHVVVTESLTVRAAVRWRYAAAQAARAATQLATESTRLAAEIAATVSNKVRSGATPASDAQRAQVEVETARLAESIAAIDAEIATARLLALWGEPASGILEFDPIPDSLPPVPEPTEIEIRLARAPDLGTLAARAEAADRRVELARALRVPDLDLEAGVRTARASGDAGLVAGAAIPLPLFDRSAGLVAAASAERARAAAELAAATRERRLAVAEALGAMRRARALRTSSTTGVLPAARRAYDEIRLGYERGRFGYIDVLESRRAVVLAERGAIEGYLAHTAALADLEAMIGELR